MGNASGESKPKGTVTGPIALDGPAASGKSTVGLALAERFGFRFLDTGLMYRAVTLAALRAGIAPAEDALGSLLAGLQMRLETNSETRVFLGDEEVTGRLRDHAVEVAVSRYSAIPAVRTAMVARQRELAADGRMVMVGRDIGSVVLPGAPVKLFLDASEEERFRRRELQDAATGTARDTGASKESVAERDRLDATRTVSPTVVPEGATVIDTTGLTVDEVVALAVARVESFRAAPAQPGPAAITRAAAERGARTPGRRFGHVRRPRLATFFPPFYWTAQYLIRLILLGVTDYRCAGRERIPASGAVVLVSNHLNDTDPFMLTVALRHSRRIRFMAKVELFTGPLGWVAPLYGAFPVRRFEADLGSMLAAERLLKKGEVVGMFPEGTRSRTGYMGPPHPGTALIALRAGATVLPVGITGTQRIKGITFPLRRPKVRVTIGEPFPLTAIKRPSKAQVSELTHRIVTAIESLLPPEYVRPYTGGEGTRDSDGGDSPRE